MAKFPAHFTENTNVDISDKNYQINNYYLYDITGKTVNYVLVGGGGSGGGGRRRCKVLSCNENHSRHYCKICKNKDSTHRSSQCPSQRSQILQMLKFGTFDLQ